MTLRKLAFYAIFIALQVAFVELSLQAFYRISNGDWLSMRVDLPLFEADDVRVYRVKSNLDYQHTSNEFSVTYYTDNFGLRSDRPDKVTRVEKEPGTYRILFLGPSFSFGTSANFEDTYVTRIERQLSVPGRKIEVINLGTPAQPVRWQLCWLETAAKDFEIDLVIQTVYGEPVLAERRCDRSPPLALIDDGRLYMTKPSFRKNLTANAKKSAIVFYSWYLYQMHFAPDEMSKGLGTEFYKEAVPDAVDSAGIVAAYREYVDYARSIVGQKTPIAFLYIPFSYMVHPEDIKRFAHLDPMSPDEVVSTTSRVAQTLEEHGIAFLNPLNALLANAKNERLYYFIDVHFTPAGNAIVADYAAPLISRIIEQSAVEVTARD